MFDQHGKRKYLNDTERRAFLKAVKREPDVMRRAFGLTLFYTGCRISEALNLTIERIDLIENSFVFETLKRRRRGVFRAVPMPDALAISCCKATLGRKLTSRVWAFSRATGYRQVKKFMAEAGIMGVMGSPKGLRHSFAIACVSKKIPLTTVQKWMGHAKLETTAIYLEVSGEEERNLAKRLWKS